MGARAGKMPVGGRWAGSATEGGGGERVIVDGETGQVLLRPSGAVLAGFTDSMVAKERQRLAYRAVRDLPSVSRDGERISLFIPAALLIDLPHLPEGGAEGIGLYRTDVPFMFPPSFPDMATPTQ